MGSFPQRNLFFSRRLLNKPVKKQGHFDNPFEEEVYLLAMKKF